MRYMLMIFADEQRFQEMAQGKTPAEVAQMTAPYAAYTDALKNAGVMKAGDRLRPTAAATTVRVSDGKTEVLNGPYAETKEQLGGYYLIDVPDLDAAISWAARCPGAGHGSVEVRPIWSME
jgi:hypothetical protein